VLARHWPQVPRYGDVTTVNGHNITPVDCVIFGSPCQDLSVAGKRAGLDGHRSSLFFEATRIIKEMRHATHTQFPRWAIWENVAGALSSNKGADFAAVLGEMADLGAYLLEWHILDARWFGVPQRRRRVFVVACFDPSTVSRCPDPLFPVASRSSWNPPQGGQKGTDFTNALTGGLGSGGPDAAHAAAGWLIAFGHKQGIDIQPSQDIFPTLRSEGGGAAFMTTAAVRRLTPTECERLMGWPDHHTRWRVDGTEQPDSTRYRQIGNGVATPVAAWIAHHITKVTQ
jgi:DNA (cytosine-5)-methyltransferase 1